MDDEKDILNNISTGYQTAINLAIYEGRLTWQTTAIFTQFAAALIVVSVYPSFINSTNNRILTVIALFFSTIGIIASLSWWSMVSRNRKYYQYWFSSARELEKELRKTEKTSMSSQKS